MKTYCAIIIVLLALEFGVQGKPAVDVEPLKFSLDTEDEKTSERTFKTDSISTSLQNGREWLDRMMDAIRFGRGRLVNSVAIAKNIIAKRVEEIASEAQNNVAGAIGAANDIIERSRTNLKTDKGPFASLLTPKTRETAKLESENDQAFFEKKSSNPISSLLENVLKPRPIVDNIKEEEKYGNNGDKFIGVGRALVNGFEGLSNFVNAIVDLPVNAAKKTSRGITEALNQLGARLVGLQ